MVTEHDGVAPADYPGTDALSHGCDIMHTQTHAAVIYSVDRVSRMVSNTSAALGCEVMAAGRPSTVGRLPDWAR